MRTLFNLAVAVAIVGVLAGFGAAIGRGYSFGSCPTVGALAGDQEASVLGVRMCREDSSTPSPEPAASPGITSSATLPELPGRTPAEREDAEGKDTP